MIWDFLGLSGPDLNFIFPTYETLLSAYFTVIIVVPDLGEPRPHGTELLKTQGLFFQKSVTGFGVNGGCGVLRLTGGLPGAVGGMGFAARLQVRGSIDHRLWFEMPVEELGSHLKQ